MKIVNHRRPQPKKVEPVAETPKVEKKVEIKKPKQVKPIVEVPVTEEDMAIFNQVFGKKAE